MNDLSGKVALITGASGGIGSAIARQFAGLGLNLVLCGRSAEKLKAVQESVAACGVQTMLYTADLTEDGAAAGLRHVLRLGHPPSGRRSLEENPHRR